MAETGLSVLSTEESQKQADSKPQFLKRGRPTPIDWSTLPTLKKEEKPPVETLIKKIEDQGVPVSSISKALMLVGGLDFVPYDVDSPVGKNDQNEPNLKYLPDDNPARQNFEKAKAFINQALMAERPDILRLAFMTEREATDIPIPQVTELQRLARAENWDVVYYFNFAEQNPDYVQNKFIRKKIQPSHDATTDVVKLAFHAIRHVQPLPETAALDQLTNPFDQTNLSLSQLPDYYAYLEQSIRDHYNVPAVNNLLTTRFNDLVRQTISMILDASQLGEINLSQQDKKTLLEAIQQYGNKFDMGVAVRPERITKQEKQHHLIWQRIVSRAFQQLKEKSSPFQIDLQAMEIDPGVRQQLADNQLTYARFLSGTKSAGRRRALKIIALGGAGAISAFLTARKSLAASEAGQPKTAENISRFFTNVASGKEVDEATLKLMEEQGDGIFSNIGQRLWELSGKPKIMPSERRIDVIQPSDTAQFDIPPQTIGEYLKPENGQRLIEGLMDLYYHGKIRFSDLKTEPEFLLHSELEELLKLKTKTIVDELKRRNLYPQLKLASLNLDKGRKVDGSLISNGHIAEEIVLFLQNTPGVDVSVLPTYSKDKGYDEDPQLEAARKRCAYLYGQLVYDRVNNQKDALTIKLSSVDELAQSTGVSAQRLVPWTKQFDWNFLSHLTQLDQTGEIDFSLMINFIDPNQLAYKMTTIKDSFSLTNLPLGIMGAVALRPSLNTYAPKAQEEILASPIKPRTLSRRTFLRLATQTAAVAATPPIVKTLAEMVSDPSDEALVFLKTADPAILPQVEKKSKLLMTDSLVSKKPGTLKIFASDGKTTIGEYAPYGYREWMSFEEIPQDFITAQVTTEDANFFKHPGVDAKGLARAAKTISYGGWQGGSTITMQLVRQFAFTPDELAQEELNPKLAYKRKATEIMLAVLWEKALIKQLGSIEEAKKYIFTLYANIAPYGPNTYGLKAASEKYFGKQPKNLSLEEITFLVGLPQSPVEYDPSSNFNRTRERQKAVLDLLVKNRATFKNGLITQPVADKIFENGIRLKLVEADKTETDPVFDWVVALLQNRANETFAEGGKVTTTIDSQLQSQTKTMVDEYLQTEMAQTNKVGEASVVIMDATDGKVLATYGNFRKDHAPGSTVKPFTYAGAFENGINRNGDDTELDSVITYQGHTIMNYGDVVSNKKVSLGTALHTSLNTVAVKTAIKLGSISLSEIFKRVGLIAQEKHILAEISPAMTLGTIRVSPLQLATAYCTLANNGTKTRPQPISQVFNNTTGALAYTANPASPQQQIMDPKVSQEVLRMIANPAYLPKDSSGNVSGSWKNIDGQIDGEQKFAAKTGTSTNPDGGPKDIWIAGTTLGDRPLSVAVWMGGKNGAELDYQASGLTVVGPLFKQIIKQLVTLPPSPASPSTPTTS